MILKMHLFVSIDTAGADKTQWAKELTFHRCGICQF